MAANYRKHLSYGDVFTVSIARFFDIGAHAEFVRHAAYSGGDL